MSNIIKLNPIEATNAHANMKETYGFISTSELLEKLSAKGWEVTNTMVAGVRKEDKNGYQKHLLRLQNPEFSELALQGDLIKPELVVLNSHDGSTSTRLFFGILRMACLNGIIAGTSFNDVRVIHSRNFVNKLNQGLDLVTNGIPELIGTIDRLSSKTFSEAALQEFVKSTVDFKLRNVKNLTAVNYDSATLVRRYGDDATNAWTMMNRIQEALLRGGIYYQYKADVYETNKITGEKVFLGQEERTRKTSAVRSIPQTIQLNRLVFDKALELAA